MTTQQAVIGIIVGLASIAVWWWDKRRNGRNDTDHQGGGGL